MMLEEERYTGKDISDRVPFIESCLRFFDEHYQYLAKKRGAKALDENGKLIAVFHNKVNPMSEEITKYLN